MSLLLDGLFPPEKIMKIIILFNRLYLHKHHQGIYNCRLAQLYLLPIDDNSLKFKRDKFGCLLPNHVLDSSEINAIKIIDHAEKKRHI